MKKIGLSLLLTAIVGAAPQSALAGWRQKLDRRSAMAEAVRRRDKDWGITPWDLDYPGRARLEPMLSQHGIEDLRPAELREVEELCGNSFRRTALGAVVDGIQREPGNRGFLVALKPNGGRDLFKWARVGGRVRFFTERNHEIGRLSLLARFIAFKSRR